MRGIHLKRYFVELILLVERLEESIKLTLKKRSVKSYRPLLENFGGYTECYNIDSLDSIVQVFDSNKERLTDSYKR